MFAVGGVRQTAGEAAALIKRVDLSAEFVRHLESLHAKYEIKRNLIGLVEQKRNSLYLT